MSTSPSISLTPISTPHFSSKLLRAHRLRCHSSSSAAAASAQQQNGERHGPAFNFPENPWMQGDGVKMPTAPWMRGPLLLPADDVLDLSKGRNSKKKKVDEDDSLTGKVRGGRSRHVMRRIVERIVKLREIDPPEEVDEREGSLDDWESEDGVEEPVFRLPIEENAAAQRGDARRKVPWAKAEKPVVFRRMKKKRVVTAAELTLPEDVLKRLRDDARKMGAWVKSKKAGVTEEVVDEIRKTWRKSELAMVKFAEPLCRNMDRAREIIETKTGGLVVWSKKDYLVVYKGCGYISHSQIVGDSKENLPSEGINGNFKDTGSTSSANLSDKVAGALILRNGDQHSLSSSMFIEVNKGKSIAGSLYEREADRLLDGLGPRFIDWWWPKPLPVDADLLPEVVPDLKLPFRCCPSYLKPKLTDDELTYLRKLARPLPTHFALGKNTKLQGLAAAIIKLWEKSPIAKIAIKRGIPNTNNELMSCELKRLTGGVLILRNKFFIILYRGKDFLPGGVAQSIVEREKEIMDAQLEEEQAREKAVKSVRAIDGIQSSAGSAGTFLEFQDILTNYNSLENRNLEVKVKIDAEKERLEKELRKQERQLSILNLKIESSEKGMVRLNSIWRLSVEAADQELLTEEERQGFHKIGLKMDEVLLLGRCGIYNGVIGSIHLHWKHREVVKVITMQSAFSQVMHSARLLEIESDGILIAVEKLKTGHAIIIYRGKNYIPPPTIFPQNLLTKREASERSIEVQRRGSLKFFANQKERSVQELRFKLRDLEERAKYVVFEAD